MCASTLVRAQAITVKIGIFYGENRTAHILWDSLLGPSVLVHDERKKLIPFVSVKALYDTAEVVDITNGLKEIAPPNAPVGY
jgi:hypothetical protein